MKMLEAELGQCYRRIADLEAELQYDKIFDGDSKDLLRAVYRGEYRASPQQIYAARSSLAFEHPPARSDGGEMNGDDEVFNHPKYIAAVSTISAALRPWPEARAAVIEALRRLEASRDALPLIEARAEV